MDAHALSSNSNKKGMRWTWIKYNKMNFLGGLQFFEKFDIFGYFEILQFLGIFAIFAIFAIFYVLDIVEIGWICRMFCNLSNCCQFRYFFTVGTFRNCCKIWCIWYLFIRGNLAILGGMRMHEAPTLTRRGCARIKLVL